ncbi:MAG: tryptophan--tRNA ligase [Candidatus Marinimicrobia bacterium]|nr:tryptophan--tRNA ligase [Candidatus Neomarinimicrobiota bacterium]
MKKQRVLSGIQPSGQLHLGNYFGMMSRMIQYQGNNDLFCFIANYHALTTIPEKDNLSKNTFEAVCDFLALGLDPEKSTFWIQSDVPQVTELTWLLSNVTPMGLLDRATSYKDKIARGISANLGLFSYPVLMAADILLFNSELVPVGKDQKQHLEMTRDIAVRINNLFGDVLVVPEPDIEKTTMLVPGTDGQKMSKSYNNIINIFLPDNKLRKQIMSIQTDSLALEDPKDPEACNVYQIYNLLASKDQSERLANKYRAGNFGYGHAKQELFDLICSKFSTEREKFTFLMSNTDIIEKELISGAVKAKVIANSVLCRVRENIGY